MSLIDSQPVVLITGVSAAGKSTVAEALARRFERGVHLRGDVFRRMVVAGRHDMTAEPTDEAVRQLHLRYRLGASTADAYHEAGFAVVVQDVIIGPALADYATAIRARPLAVVVLTPSVDAVAEREAARPKTAYGPDRASIEALDEALRDETPRLGLWLDTTTMTPADVVDTILARAIPEGLVS